MFVIKILLVFRDGPAGGVDAIYRAKMLEVRGDHCFVVRERGDLLVGKVADVAAFGPGFGII